jgi:hypothetical protein
MRILLDNVIERNAISCVCGADVEQGMILKIDGLATMQYGDGECYKTSLSANSDDDIYVVVAHDGHSYTTDEYNFGDKATIKAGEPFRAYVLTGYQVITVEKAVVSGTPTGMVGSDASGKWVTVTSDPVGRVLKATKLEGKDAYQILIVR